jgi:hypothetical protein
MPTYKKDISYLGRDFAGLRSNLIEFAKTYFPNTYKDFNESAPGTMFLESVAYVGDVLGYYIDAMFKESLLPYAEEKNQVYNIAQFMGYTPRLISPSMATVTFSQEVPAMTDDPTQPDYDYALNIKSTTRLFAPNFGVEYRLLTDCNFKVDQGDVVKEISQTSTDGTIEYYRLHKKITVVSGYSKKETFTFGSPIKYDRITLSEENVTDIISVTDGDGNTWYEVPFLAQDMVFTEFQNIESNDSSLVQFDATNPYILKRLKTSKRFRTYVRPDKKTEMRFGAGTLVTPDEELIPNPDNVGSNLPGSPSKLGIAFDPNNFTNTRAYGEAPSNTTLEITYAFDGGSKHNVRSGEINSFASKIVTSLPSTLDGTKITRVNNSLNVVNDEPSSGGMDVESVEEIKQNAMAFFQAQSRSVTRDDILVRIYALPERYGNIAKAYVVQDEQITTQPGEELTFTKNQFGLNLYLLGYNNNRKLTKLNDVTKKNLKVYLDRFRMVTDAYNIKDAYIVNIAIKFDILTKKGYNKNEVLLNAINEVKNYFNIDLWQINQPLVIAEVVAKLIEVEGVVGVETPSDSNPLGTNIVIENRYDTAKGYSGNVYDLGDPMVIKNGVVYPSRDPAIFELKFPDTDIIGRVVGDV